MKYKYSLTYDFVRSRQLDNSYDQGPEVGVWPITAYRVDYGWGKVPAEYWPDTKENRAKWPPTEPPGLDLIAKKYRGSSYQRIRSVDDGRLAIFYNLGFGAAFMITNQWLCAKQGIISDLEPVLIGAAHFVDIVGYNDRLKSLRFANCWGKDWGDKGYGQLSYEYFQNHYVEGWTSIGWLVG